MFELLLSCVGALILLLACLHTMCHGLLLKSVSELVQYLPDEFIILFGNVPLKKNVVYVPCLYLSACTWMATMVLCFVLEAYPIRIVDAVSEVET